MVEEQCIRFLRDCNSTFHGQLDGPAKSGVDALRKEFEANNSYNHFVWSMEGKVQMDLYQYFPIGFCYQENNERRSATSENA